MRPIVIDTREQRPWEFPEWVPVRHRKLDFGDYALEGDAGYAIERKSLSDFVGTLSSGRERFGREMARAYGSMARMDVIVEASFHQIMFNIQGGEILPPEYGHPKVNPGAVCKWISELMLEDGVSILFCDDPSHAAYMAYALLLERSMILDR